MIVRERSCKEISTRALQDRNSFFVNELYDRVQIIHPPIVTMPLIDNKPSVETQPPMPSEAPEPVVREASRSI